MKVLVVGGCGFIGYNVAGVLINNSHEVDIFDLVVPDHIVGFNVIQGNINNKEDLQKLGKYDAVIHLAGMLGTSATFENVLGALETNILGTVKLIEQQVTDGPFIQLNLLGRWLNPYMISKNTIEKLGFMFKREYGLKYMSIRATDVYGPWQSTKQGKAVPTFIMQALNNKPIRVYGSGDYEMKLFYVKDAAKVIARALDWYNQLPDVFDIGSMLEENNIRVADLAVKIKTIAGYPDLPIDYEDMRRGQPEEVIRYKFDYNKTRGIYDLLNISETPLNEGLKRTVDWYYGYLNSRCVGRG